MWPFNSRKSIAPAIRNPDLGELRFEDGNWTTRLRRIENDLELSIAGTVGGPHPMARTLLVEHLSRLDSEVTAATEFLLREMSAEDQKHGPYRFRPTGIWSGAVWQVIQRSVTLTLELEGDPEGLWRVEMGPNGPLDSGRDS